MSNLVPFSDRDKKLIRDTVAKGATEVEFQLFIHRCQNMGLDPLKPGQVHFVKYGSNPGTMIVGIDGFRARAARTGKHAGTKRGIIRDDANKCIGAWCEVYRSDWTQPAREEVSLIEYNTYKSMWAKMPETMIKKVAEVAALRMAFPDELGGLYSADEMDQAEPLKAPPDRPLPTIPTTRDVEEAMAQAPMSDLVRPNPGDYKITMGKKYKGLTMKQAVDKFGLADMEAYCSWLVESSHKAGYSKPSPEGGEFIQRFEAYKATIDLLDSYLSEEDEAQVERMIDEDRGSRYNLPEEHLKT